MSVRVVFELEGLAGNLSKQKRLIGMEQSLESVGLKSNKVLAKFPYQLFGGQRQPVMMVRALMLRPKLLIADEPTSALDASLKVSTLNLLKDITAEYRMSVLFITHDIGQAYYLCDRILVIYHSEMVEKGTVEEVVTVNTLIPRGCWLMRPNFTKR